MTPWATVRATPEDTTGSSHSTGLRYVNSRMTTTTATVPSSNVLSMPSNALLESAACPAGPVT